MRKFLLALALLLLPFVASAAIATPWNATSTDKGYISPNLINGNSPWLVIGGTGTSTFAGPIQATCFTLNGTNCLTAGVTSFNTRTGAITLTLGDVTGALGFTPYNSTNPSGYISNITGLVTAGTNVTITGAGTSGSPYVINSAGSGSGTISTSSPLVAGQGVYATGVSTIASVATSTPAAGTGLSYTGTFGSFFGGTSGSLNLANTAVSPGSYTNTNITVDQQGRITAASNGTASGTGLSTTSPWTAGNVAYVASNSSVSSVATSTPTLGVGLSYSGALGSFVSGSSGALSVATSSFYTGTAGQFPYFSDINTITATSTPFLAPNGFLGVGTTNPLLQLDVLGQMRVTSGTFPPFEAVRTTAVTNSQVTGMSLTASSSGVMADGFGSFFNFRIADSVTAPTVLANIGASRNGANNTGDLVFITNNAGSQTEKMRILANGNTGIGTTSPYAKLSVMAGGNYASQAASTAFAVGSSTAGTATSTLLSVLTSGNVNIGSASTPGGGLYINRQGSSLPAGLVVPTSGITVIGDGVTNPNADGADRIINLYVRGNTANFLGSRFDGTIAAPTGVLVNESIANYGSNVYDGTAFRAQANFLFTADDNIDATNRGTRFDLQLTAASTTGRQTVLRVVGNGGTAIGSTYAATPTNGIPTGGLIVQGNVGIGTTSPVRPLSIVGSSYFAGPILATSTLTLSALANPAGSFLAVDGNGVVGATTTPTGGTTGGSTQGVQWATSAVLAGTPTYSNGSSGVGATLTEVGSGALTVDGNSPAAADRVLVKNQASAFQNGIYTVTATGSGIASYILTRTTDYNTATLITPGIITYVIGGTANTDTTWAVTYTAPLTIGTTNLTYVESAGAVGVSSISNADGTLTISPTTGAAVASLALGHANIWTALQRFSNASSTLESAYQAYFGGVATSTFDMNGTLSLSTAGTSTLQHASATQLAIGSLTGILRATAGYVTTGLVNLASDVTGFLGITNGGTGTSTPPAYGKVLVGNLAGTGYDYVATSTFGGTGTTPSVTTIVNAAQNTTGTASTTIYRGTVPGGLLGTKNVIELLIPVETLTLPNTGSIWIEVGYGGATTTVQSRNAVGSTKSFGQGSIEFIIQGNGATNAQAMTVIGKLVTTGPQITVQPYDNFFTEGSTGTDSTVSQPLTIIQRLDTAGSTFATPSTPIPAPAPAVVSVFNQ